MKKLLVLMLLLPLPLCAAETGYKVVHPDGTVEFTDDPHSGGKPIELKEAPTFKSIPPASTADSKPKKTESKKSSDEKQGVNYQSVTVTYPKAAQTFWFDGSGVNFTVAVKPALASTDEVVIDLDGKGVARGNQTNFVVNGIVRGAHKVTAKIVNAKGDTLVESSPVTFYMQRHTIKKTP